ncbi:helix-turn-helix transcriptional regulator [Nocardiopsis sp. N85]|uniref:Helix-turn-helix transcriptional regulator n=1 Tax=Nocardiopsis lambiniae TaxID=3075539 RepID=A0ABU2M8E0_9ACTN|nr:MULTISPECIES: helix-turn-helix transcriptional regulator [unclassified Nocardiopsis]MDE3724560.1 helix-turn-helix transcriptional regulator [Nocardiopsis sp. N85]MDT0328430.1 helix-turn-helix transcriptional regulator [Nocardiopsis sp. DSM 44743]
MEVAETAPVGALLREWRNRRRLSQLELSLRAEVSARHLSFVETGRSRPGREMILRLGECLDVPLRERNRLLLAAGYAPAYAERTLDDADMGPVREVVRRLLAGHDPYPAVVIDRDWTLVDANAGAALLLEGVAPDLLAPPVNVLRVGLHPRGMAPAIANLGQWRAHLLHRLRLQVDWTGDADLAALYRELVGYPGGDPGEPSGTPPIAVPLRLHRDGTELSFLSTVATFGTPLDVTVSELAIESFFPADAATARLLGAGRPAE